VDAFRVMAVVGVMVGVGACGGGGAETPYRPLLDMQGLMHWVLEPAADVVWDSAGSVLTVAGEEDLAPVDDAGWEAVGHAAAVLAESGNLLMLPGRAEPEADWLEYATAMIDVGERLMTAAEARDDDAVFDLGGQLYNVCVACHQRYAIELGSRVDTGP
jgi:hypothetical protein